jgi:HK97 family phage major capsid protein
MIPISANSNGLTLYGVDETSRVAGSRRGGVRGYWASEGDEKTSSKPKFREINLRLNKLVGLVYATDELLADAAALGAYVQQVLPEELRFLAEDAIINGTGAGQPLGVLNAGCLVSVAKETGQAADTVVAENIIKMWSRRWAGNNDYIWLVNQDVTPQLHQLNLPVGTGGALVYMPPGGLSQSPYGSLYGRPVIETEYNDTVGDQGDIILFSPSAYQMIDKGGIQSASSIHVRFIYDETVFRFVYRVDGQPLWHQPLTPYKSSNTQSPFVALDARA